MMAMMLSSPIGPTRNTGRYDLFDRPSSPTYKQNDDLPAEFGDQSFGSSMSLGSSFELSRMVASSSSSTQLAMFAATTIQKRVNDEQATIRMPVRRNSPRSGQDSLGAAMGTVLNSRSPGLAAKMNSSDYMDMSSPPPRQQTMATPPKSSRNSHRKEPQDLLPPGSAMKEDTPAAAQESYVTRRCASMTTTTMEGSLGRLFGTELSVNAQQFFPPDFDASGSPIAPTARPRSRPGMLRKPSKDDSSPLGYGTGKRLKSKQSESLSPVPAGEESGSSLSPYRSAEGMPGFGASEREGKILPCFNIKDDGLMRIKPSTLIEVMSGIYNHQMDGFQIVDCRFGYEYEGGHIAGAINLSTVEAVKKHFLHPEGIVKLPRRSQSGKPDSAGVWKKKVLIFHCEFSAKRAPSMALALRQADRGLAHDYPNCHYPEVYILQGGYCGFFKEFANVCEPRFYVQMDDPKFLDMRSKELNGFRKQFARHRSFTFGENANSNASRQLASEGSKLIKHTSSFVRPIKEESSSENTSASPSAIQANVALARRKLTKGVSSNSTSSRNDSIAYTGIGLHSKTVLGGSAPVTIGDLSFGNSSFGDSSFEGGPSDSPCAAAATNRRPRAVFLKKASTEGATPTFNSTARGGTSGSLGRRTFQRASTAAHIQMR